MLLTGMWKDLGIECVHDQITGFWCAFFIPLTGLEKAIGIECVHDQITSMIHSVDRTADGHWHGVCT